MKLKIGVFILTIFSLCTDLDSQLANHSKAPCDNVQYHLNIYNIRRGPANLDPSIIPYGDNLAIDFLVQEANRYFKDACIQFKYCIIDTLFDYNYYNIGEKYTAEDTDLFRQFNKPYSINIFWVNIKRKATFNGICAGKEEVKGIQYFATGSGGDDTLFTQRLWSYFGLDITDPTFKEYYNPIPCRKFSREQVEFLVTNERRCRRKRWE